MSREYSLNKINFWKINNSSWYIFKWKWKKNCGKKNTNIVMQIICHFQCAEGVSELVSPNQTQRWYDLLKYWINGWREKKPIKNGCSFFLMFIAFKCRMLMNYIRICNTFEMECIQMFIDLNWLLEFWAHQRNYHNTKINQLADWKTIVKNIETVRSSIN